MPRKAKEKVIENEVIEEKIKKVKSSSTSKKKVDDTKTTVSKKKNTKNDSTGETTKKVSKKEKSEVEKVGASTKKDSKASTNKKSTITKKNDDSGEKKSVASSRKKSVASSEKKSTTSSRKKSDTSPEKKSATSSRKKSTTSSRKKTEVPKKDISTEPLPVQIVEYYDLPLKYGNTLVKLLAQTPKTLFVYWEISELDIENFKQQYGDTFFNITKPILLVHNLTLNKTTEIEINDFASCWYLNTEDSDCKFDIELARKFIDNPNISKNTENNLTSYVQIAKSNDLQSPNDHILFEKLENFITFTDTSTGEKIYKNIKSFNFLKDLYDFYKNMYKDEILNNPSSTFNF